MTDANNDKPKRIPHRWDRYKQLGQLNDDPRPYAHPKMWSSRCRQCGAIQYQYTDRGASARIPTKFFHFFRQAYDRKFQDVKRIPECQPYTPIGA